jgi:hypothetical protein
VASIFKDDTVKSLGMEGSKKDDSIIIVTVIFISVTSISIEEKETVESPRMEDIPRETTP